LFIEIIIFHFAVECRSKKVPRDKTDEAKFVHDKEDDDIEGLCLWLPSRNKMMMMMINAI
jgi:hypothetical protein